MDRKSRLIFLFWKPLANTKNIENHRKYSCHAIALHQIRFQIFFFPLTVCSLVIIRRFPHSYHRRWVERELKYLYLRWVYEPLVTCSLLWLLRLTHCWMSGLNMLTQGRWWLAAARVWHGDRDGDAKVSVLKAVCSAYKTLCRIFFPSKGGTHTHTHTLSDLNTGSHMYPSITTVTAVLYYFAGNNP